MRPPLSMNVSRGCRWGGDRDCRTTERKAQGSAVSYVYVFGRPSQTRAAPAGVLTRPQHRARQWRGNRGAACSVARGRHRTPPGRAIAPKTKPIALLVTYCVCRPWRVGRRPWFARVDRAVSRYRLLEKTKESDAPTLTLTLSLTIKAYNKSNRNSQSHRT